MTLYNIMLIKIVMGVLHNESLQRTAWRPLEDFGPCQALRNFIRNFQSQKASDAKPLPVIETDAGDTDAGATATFREVENLLSRLQAHGSLPSGRTCMETEIVLSLQARFLHDNVAT